jgi:hypothetical protein
MLGASKHGKSRRNCFRSFICSQILHHFSALICYREAVSLQRSRRVVWQNCKIADSRNGTFCLVMDHPPREAPTFIRETEEQ